MKKTKNVTTVQMSVSLVMSLNVSNVLMNNTDISHIVTVLMDGSTMVFNIVPHVLHNV
jgi:hypothetical protein